MTCAFCLIVVLRLCIDFVCFSGSHPLKVSVTSDALMGIADSLDRPQYLPIRGVVEMMVQTKATIDELLIVGVAQLRDSFTKTKTHRSIDASRRGRVYPYIRGFARRHTRISPSTCRRSGRNPKIYESRGRGGEPFCPAPRLLLGRQPVHGRRG